VAGREAVRVPGHAAWFRAGEIHPLEAETLAEFFDGSSASKTPQVYLEYRAHLLDRARAAPGGRITFTECRKGLLGDVNAIWRVFNFLTEWGLVSDGGRKRPAGFAGGAGGAAGGGVAAPPARKAMRIHAPALGDEHNRLFRFDPRAPPAGGSTGALAGGLEKQFGGQGAAAGGGGGGEGGSGGPRFRCNVTGKDCTMARYHCTAVPDFDVSADVDLENADLPPGVTPADFILIEGEPAGDGKAAAAGATGRPWTDHEELLLLEGLELHKDNWAEVAEHVGSRSQLECVVHFVQLPVDATLHEREGGPRDGAGNGSAPAEPLCVLADAGNPIMAQIAFLAGVVGPKVAAAAAEKALEVLRKTSPALVAGSHLASEEKGAKIPANFPAPGPAAAGAATGPAAADAAQIADTAAAAAEAGEAQPAPAGGPAKGPEDAEMGEAGQGKGEPATLPPPDEPPSPASLAAASAAALAVAAVKAKLLAEKEERAVRALMSEVVSTQMQKVQLKLNSLEHLETVMKQQAEQLEREQQQLFSEQVRMQAVRNGAVAALPPARYA